MGVLVCSLKTLKELVKILTDCPSIRIVILMDVALNCAEVIISFPDIVCVDAGKYKIGTLR